MLEDQDKIIVGINGKERNKWDRELLGEIVEVALRIRLGLDWLIKCFGVSWYLIFI